MRGWTHRASVVGAIAVSLAILFFGRAEAFVFDRLRDVVAGATSPVFEVLSPPLQSARRMFARVFEIATVFEENERLRAENERLLAWQETALALENKIARYEALLEMPLSADVHYRSGRIISDPGGPFVKTLLLDLGRVDGVAEGQGVIDAKGFIGRIVQSGSRSSRVLLITDFNSRVPVRVEPFAIRGILIGQNDAPPVISYLPKDHGVVVGQAVVTSGDGGLIPAGLPVGTVVSVSEDQAVIKPKAAFDRLLYVRVLEHLPIQLDVPGSSDGPPLLQGPPVPPPPVPATQLPQGTTEAAVEPPAAAAPAQGVGRPAGETGAARMPQSPASPNRKPKKPKVQAATDEPPAPTAAPAPLPVEAQEIAPPPRSEEARSSASDEDEDR